MATTLQSDLKTYDPRIQAGFWEGLYRVIQVFNEASGGTIRFTGQEKEGDYDYRAFWKDVSGLINRRDMTSVSAATPTKSTQGEFVGVKVNRRIGPHDVTRGSLLKIGLNPGADAAMVALGDTVANKVAEDRLDTGLLALAGALRNQAAVTYDGTGDTTTTMTSDKLPKALRKFGDASGDVTAWVMHSTPFFDLFEEQMASTVTGIGNVLLYEARPGTLNRPVIVLDSPSLVFDNGGTDNFVTLGLTPGALEIEDTEQEYITMQEILGNEQIIHRMQGEYATNYSMKGFAYDVANGGKNPTNSTIGTGSNWDPVVASAKGYAGVALVTE